MATHASFEAALEAATADRPEVTAAHRAALAAHWALVSAWNRQVNLMGRMTPTEAAYLHYRDALEALPWLGAGAVLDVGSGGGFPGIPLAIVRERAPITLMEPRNKRASLLTVAAARLHLPHVTVLTARLEQAPTGAFDRIVTRATFSDLAALAAAVPWMAPGARLIAFRSAQAPLAADAMTALAAAGLHYAEGHHYTLAGHGRRLDVWTLSQDSGDKGRSRSTA